MGLCMLWLSAVLLHFPALILAYRVTGSVGETLMLPCGFPASKSPSNLCWGRGSCSAFGCNSPIVKVQADNVTWKKSERYRLKGIMGEGDAALEVTDVTLDDSGTYCCRVKTTEYDLKREISVEIQHPLKDDLVRGPVDSILSLPCKYSAKEGKSPMCWGRGSCGLTGCPSKILSTDGEKVTWTESNRYELRGNILEGDVSLTLNGVFKEDEGTYCCRVEIPGPFNDVKKDVQLNVEDVDLVRGSLGDKLTLPCSYATDAGTRTTCWGRGHCGILLCHDEVLKTDGDAVTWRESKRYQLNENILKGNVSLTIDKINENDGGVYCCRVRVPGAFNDIKKEVRLEIHNMDRVKALFGDTVKLPCSYNITEGTTKMCWGKGSCPRYKCTETIVWTDGEQVTWTESGRYHLKGNLEHGDVSLSIRSISKEDEGTYCCRVEIPGLFNDKLKEIKLEVEDDGLQTGIKIKV
ncbi:polymeric immunoglobulin receptor-like [Mantella aurantiaca]